jgi:endonuclease/exonuclease/phosphatase family metal-dependent hydrolase
MVKLICYNIEYCEGMEGLWYQYLQFWKIFNPPKGIDQRIVDSFSKLDPDVLALVEIDLGSMRCKKNQVDFFKKNLKMRSQVSRVKYSFDGWMKMFHHVPILSSQANAILSKYKIDYVKYHMLHEGTKRLVIESTIKCPKKVTLLLAHLALGKRTREKQIAELVKIVNSKKNPVILMGDFNTFNGVEEIDTLLQETHLIDKASLDVHSMTLTQPTWHPKRRLDYVLFSDSIRVKRYNVLNFHFSDHMPLFVEFDV